MSLESLCSRDNTNYDNCNQTKLLLIWKSSLLTYVVSVLSWTSVTGVPPYDWRQVRVLPLLRVEQTVERLEQHQLVVLVAHQRSSRRSGRRLAARLQQFAVDLVGYVDIPFRSAWRCMTEGGHPLGPRLLAWLWRMRTLSPFWSFASSRAPRSNTALCRCCRCSSCGRGSTTFGSRCAGTIGIFELSTLLISIWAGEYDIPVTAVLRYASNAR